MELDIDRIINLIITQVPMLVMSINMGHSIISLLPVILAPLIIYGIQSLHRITKIFKRESIPKGYVSYTIGDDNSVSKYGPYINFVTNLSSFLNIFCPKSIKSGNVTAYRKIKPNNDILYACYTPVISPDDRYFYKFMFNDKIGDITIFDKIKESGFVFPDKLDENRLLTYPIYITFETRIEEETEGKQNKKKQKNRQYIKIYTIDLNAAEDFIYIVNNYETFLTNNIANFKLCKYMHFYDSKADDGYRQLDFIVSVKKNYHNVFLSEENYDKIVKNIESWKKNKTQLIDQGIPNKLGFFITGIPGCGKTSLVYAIANETKKHIVSINLQDFTNISFMSLMSTIENKVVVFDDIDTYDFTHIRTETINVENTEIGKVHALLSSVTDKKTNYFSLSEKKMTLDTFLEVLDGYNYLNNCIVIITSNHPEKLDPAITRSGRMNHVIEFKKCDEYQFRNLFKYYIGIDYKTVDPKFVFNEYVYSTAYLINTVILPNVDNPKMILDLIR